MSSSIENKKGAWLIPIAVFGVLIWPIPALIGLFWGRSLHPFSKLGILGCLLCWFSITLLPFGVGYLYFNDNPLELDNIWQLGLYLFFIVVWLLVAKSLTKKSSFSVKKVFLVAILGTLLIAPSMSTGEQALFLPLIVAIFCNSILPLPIGVTNIFHLFLSMSAFFLPVFIGFLFTYWPFSKSKNLSAIEKVLNKT